MYSLDYNSFDLRGVGGWWKIHSWCLKASMKMNKKRKLNTAFELFLKSCVSGWWRPAGVGSGAVGYPVPVRWHCTVAPQIKFCDTLRL